MVSFSIRTDVDTVFDTKTNEVKIFHQLENLFLASNQMDDKIGEKMLGHKLNQKSYLESSVATVGR